MKRAESCKISSPVPTTIPAGIGPNCLTVLHAFSTRNERVGGGHATTIRLIRQQRKTDKFQRIKWKGQTSGKQQKKENITQRIIKSGSAIDGPLPPISFLLLFFSFVVFYSIDDLNSWTRAIDPRSSKRKTI